MKQVIMLWMVLISALAFTAGCRDFNTENEINNIHMTDYSLTVSNEVFKSYIKFYFEHVYDRLSLNDETVNIPIDRASENEASIIFHESFNSMDFLGNDKIVTHAQDSVDARFLRYKQSQYSNICAAFYKVKQERKKDAGYTDIIRSLLIASKYIIRDTIKKSNIEAAQEFAEGKKNFKIANLITISSDMRNDEPGQTLYRFDNFNNITKDEIIERINALQKNGLVADLKGSYIIINGASTTGKNATTLYENIKFFWQEYFKRAGAILVAYDYDASMDIDNFFKRFRS